MKTLMRISLVLTLVLVIGNLAIAQPKTSIEYDKYLIKSLDDENLGIRSSAAQLIGERKVENAVKPLMTMLKTEKHYSARIIAAIALYQIGDERAVPTLKEYARNDKNKTVRRVLTGLVQEIETNKLAQK